MGQVVNYLNRKFRELDINKVIFEPYIDKPSIYYELFYPHYLQGTLNRQDLFMSGFVSDLNCFEMEEIILKYYLEKNANQEELIKLIDKQAYYISNRKYDEYFNEIENDSIKLSNGRYLHCLVRQKLKFEKELKHEVYLLKVCSQTKERILHSLNTKILKYKDIVANELSEKGDIQKYKFLSEDVICAYMVLEEKNADKYLETAISCRGFKKGLAFEILVGKWNLIDDNGDKYLPFIDLKNGCEIGKIDINRAKFQPVTFLSYIHEFHLSKLLSDKAIDNPLYFKSVLVKLFNKLDCDINEKDIDTFYNSITQTGVLSNTKFEYKTVQIKLNEALKIGKNKEVFLCTLSLIHNTFTNNSLLEVLAEYFSPDLQMSKETFKNYLYRLKDGKALSKIESNKSLLMEILPKEYSTFTSIYSQE